ncbi:MAG: hypothetical protein KF803_01455 [Cyclobacteriaceae bacterium]|nr:hypothetical protein [Cyclobacteriaceae bacterium]
MAYFRMKYFLFSVYFIFLSACASYYKNLQPVAIDTTCIDAIKPQGIASAWFSTSVDVMNKHISGLLLIKEMPDQSQRIVFTNEVGVTFFDFEFDPDGRFEVKKIISQLNRKPIIETLRKDFSLLMGLPFKDTLQAWQHNGKLYFGTEVQSEKYYFVASDGCITVESVEIGSKRKKKVSITYEGEDIRNPESVLITHFTFNMTLKLKRIDKNAD